MGKNDRKILLPESRPPLPLSKDLCCIVTFVKKICDVLESQTSNSVRKLQSTAVNYFNKILLTFVFMPDNIFGFERDIYCVSESTTPLAVNVIRSGGGSTEPMISK